MFKTVVLVWKCLNDTALGYLSELCVPVAAASGRQHLRSASTSLLQVPRARTMICRRSFAVVGPVFVEQSSGCSRETGDDTAHFQVTTQGLSVPHLMCRRTEETSTTARHCCGVFHESGAGYKTADLLTYLITTTKSKSIFHTCVKVFLPVPVQVMLITITKSTSIFHICVKVFLPVQVMLITTKKSTSIFSHLCKGILTCTGYAVMFLTHEVWWPRPIQCSPRRPCSADSKTD